MTWHTAAQGGLPTVQPYTTIPWLGIEVLKVSFYGKKVGEKHVLVVSSSTITMKPFSAQS